VGLENVGKTETLEFRFIEFFGFVEFFGLTQ